MLVETLPFGVLLHEAQQDPSRPLLRVEVVELQRLARLDVLGVGIVLGIGVADDCVQEVHPRARELFDFRTDLVVNSLPQEFDAEVDVLGVLSDFEELLEGREDCLEELNVLEGTSKK